MDPRFFERPKKGPNCGNWACTSFYLVVRTTCSRARLREIKKDRTMRLTLFFPPPSSPPPPNPIDSTLTHTHRNSSFWSLLSRNYCFITDRLAKIKRARKQASLIERSLPSFLHPSIFISPRSSFFRSREKLKFERGMFLRSSNHHPI